MRVSFLSAIAATLVAGAFGFGLRSAEASTVTLTFSGVETRQIGVGGTHNINIPLSGVITYNASAIGFDNPNRTYEEHYNGAIQSLTLHLGGKTYTGGRGGGIIVVGSAGNPDGYSSIDFGDAVTGNFEGKSLRSFQLGLSDHSGTFDGGSTELPSTFNLSQFTSGGINLGFSGGEMFGSVLSANASVPEPTTWAMMMLGVAAIGFAARRRSRGLTLAA